MRQKKFQNEVRGDRIKLTKNGINDLEGLKTKHLALEHLYKKMLKKVFFPYKFFSCRKVE
jgi:hypothetical protein